jgi:hypothetical protein
VSVSTAVDDPDRGATTPCSDLTRAAADDPVGSGTGFSSFLLLDYRMPWGRDAAGDAARDLLAPRAAATALSSPGLRAFAIRPVQDRRGTVVAPAYAGTVGLDAQLTVLSALPDEPAVTGIAGGTPPGEPSDRVLIGVCTNARRDRCCAVRGRPVATALQAEFGDAITEISHLGGHRYAATVLVLPTGYSYGFLDPGAARDAALAALDGLVHPAHLRGRADLAPAAQAADAFWRTEIGSAPVDAVRIESVQTDGDEAVVTGVVQGGADRLLLRRVPGPAIPVTACGGKPIATGRWTVRRGG